MNEIFEILENNARATPEQIAAMVDMPDSKVQSIIKKAERDKTILKYKTIVNWAKLGKEEVRRLSKKMSIENWKKPYNNRSSNT